MSWVDVDVIAKTQIIVGGVEEKSLKAFRTELENQHALAKAFKVSSGKLLVKDVVSVDDMVKRILSGIGNRRIRRLRIFGHGSPGIIQMGPFEQTAQRFLAFGPRRIAWSDRQKVIHITLTPGRRYDLNQRNTLKKLKGHFDPRGWVELQSCRVMKVSLVLLGGYDWEIVPYGKKLIESLSNLWNVPVQASDALQAPGGGLEGNVWQARPAKPAEIILRQPQSSTLNPASRTLLAGSNSLRKALERLKPPSAAGTRLTQKARLGVVSIYEPTKAASYFTGQGPISMTKNRLSQYAVNPSLKAVHTQFNPLKAAIAHLRGPSQVFFPLSKMPPGTTYSNINTGKTFRISASGRHIDTGMTRGFIPKNESSLISRTFRAHHDPLQNAFDALKPKPRAGFHMPPGTSYSNITTGRSYVVNPMGRHVQTGSIKGFIPQPGFDRGLIAQRIRNDPLRKALWQLRG